MPAELAWKERALAALDKQAEWELNSGYDVKESLFAVSSMKDWVLRNTASDKATFLLQLEEFYLHAKNHCAFPGEYSGGIATLGSCKKVIEAAVLRKEPAPESALRQWCKRRYPHWFGSWQQCVKTELKSLALGLSYGGVIALLIYLFFWQ